MPYRTNMIYYYDGTLKGFLCCVFESYSKKEIPINILDYTVYEPSLFEVKFIKSNNDIAKRVYSALKNQFNGSVLYLINTAFLSGDFNKEKIIFDFVRLCFRYGDKTVNNYNIAAVSEIHGLARAVEIESNHYLGFVRFKEYDGHLISIINPKHSVLPVIKEHFCNRFANERFLIFDKTHKSALFYVPYRSKIVPIDNIELPKESEEESAFCNLWALYYDTIAIKARLNEKCRSTHMVKRFWSNLTEMQYAESFNAINDVTRKSIDRN